MFTTGSIQVNDLFKLTATQLINILCSCKQALIWINTPIFRLVLGSSC